MIFSFFFIRVSVPKRPSYSVVENSKNVKTDPDSNAHIQKGTYLPTKPLRTIHFYPVPFADFGIYL